MMPEAEIKRAWNTLEIHDMSYQQFRREMRIITDENLAAEDLQKMHNSVRRGRVNKQKFDRILKS